MDKVEKLCFKKCILNKQTIEPNPAESNCLERCAIKF